jgi:endogenous inhibitor of DNA gyrase (YacG/DUF329 family)
MNDNNDIGDKAGAAAQGQPKAEKSAEVVPLRKPRPCPICGQKSQPKWHPFCSKRCADIDLHRWLSGSYAIPAVEDERVEEAPEIPDGDGGA